MQILTQELIETRLGTAELIRLTDDALDGEINASVLDQVASDAEAKLLIRIRQQFVVPLSLSDAMTAAAVRAHCMAMAVFDLYVRRDRQATEDIAAAAKAADTWAMAVRDGKEGLPGETPVATSPISAGNPTVVSSDPVFTRSNWAGM